MFLAKTYWFFRFLRTWIATRVSRYPGVPFHREGTLDPVGGRCARSPGVEYGIASFMRKILALLLFLAFLAAGYYAYQSGLAAELSDYDRLVETLRRDGLWGPLACIGVQFVQVIIFAIPGEVTQVAAGYVFGAWAGFLYSWVGIMLGSSCAFGFSRLVGRPVMERILGAKRLAKIDHVLETRRGKSALFTLFLIPGMPKDSMSFAVGLTEFKLGEFVVLSGLGRAPALLFSTMIGSQLYERDYFSLGVTVVVAVAAAAGFFLYERRRGR